MVWKDGEIFWDYENKMFSVVKEVYSVGNEEERKKLAEDFTKGLAEEFSQNHEFMIERILEIKSDVILKKVPEKLMTSLKEAIFCYVNGQYLSTIAAIGIASEMFCTHLYERYLEEGELPRIEEMYLSKKFRKNTQINRIQKLEKIGIGDAITFMLKEINLKRNNAVHPGEDFDYKPISLECLQIIIDLLNLYSETEEEMVKEEKLKNKEKIKK